MSKLSRFALVWVLVLVGCSIVATGASADGDRASILVKVEPGADPDAVAARHGMEVVRYLPEIRWAEMMPLPGTGVPREGDEVSPVQLRGLGSDVSDDPAVRSVDTASDRSRVSWNYVPSDPVFRPEAVLPESGAQAGWHFTLPNFPVAWDRARGTGVLVAVIDSEFDTNHPELRDKLVNRYNVASGTAGYRTPNVNPLPGDQAHGSHVAGLVGAATDNGIAVAGACFDCPIMAIKLNASEAAPVSDAQFAADVAEGILYAANGGARVINMSLGGARVHQVQLDAVNYAAARGLVVIASAGNSQEEAPGRINYPAAFPNVIAVAATDRSDTIGGFSAQGSFVDIAAPGKDVLSTTSAAEPPESQLNFGGVLVSVKSGTSMSAPIVAGLAALMLSVRPDLNPAEVETLLKSSARDLGIGGPDPIYGAGRIDAAAAVAAAISYVRPVPPPPPPPPPARKPARRVAAKVSLRVKLRAGKVQYLGSVSSKNKRCLAKRVVYLRAKRSNVALAETKTTKRGGFKLSLKKRPRKRVQVVVKAKKLGPRLVCKGAQSKFVN